MRFLPFIHPLHKIYPLKLAFFSAKTSIIIAKIEAHKKLHYLMCKEKTKMASKQQSSTHKNNTHKKHQY
jgi:hypothetical protein